MYSYLHQQQLTCDGPNYSEQQMTHAAPTCTIQQLTCDAANNIQKLTLYVQQPTYTVQQHSHAEP